MAAAPLSALGQYYGLSPATLAGLAKVITPAELEDAQDRADWEAGAPKGFIVKSPPPPRTTPVAKAATAAAAEAKKGVNAAPAKPITPLGPGDPAPLFVSNASNAPKPEAPAPALDPTSTKSLLTYQAPPAAPAPAAPADPNATPTPPADMGGPQESQIVGPRPGAGVAVPAQWVPGTKSLALHHGMNPDELETGAYYRDEAHGARLLAADANLQAAQRQGMHDAVYSAAQVAANEKLAADFQRLRVNRDAYVEREQAKLGELSDAANARIDPEDYWKDKGTGTRVLFGILAGLGQFAAGWKGGPNAALDIINGAINRNIDAQKTNLNQATKAYDVESNLYRMNLDAFGDKERATIATKIQYLDQVKAQLDQQHALTIGPLKNEAAYQNMLAELADKRATEADKFAQLTHTQADEQMNSHFIPAHTVGGGADIGEKGKSELFVDLGGGHGYMARTKEEAVLARTRAAQTQVAVNDLEGVKKVYQELENTPVWDVKTRRQLGARIDQLRGHASQVMTVRAQQGAMSKGDEAVAHAAQGLEGATAWADVNPLELGIKSRIKTIDGAITTLQQENGRIGTGGQRASEGYVWNPKTNTYEPRHFMAGSNAPYRNEVDNLDPEVRKPEGRVKK